MLQAALETVRLMVDGAPMRVVRGPDAAFDAFARAFRILTKKLSDAHDPLDLLAIAGETVDTQEEYALRTTAYFREQGEQMQAIIRMLTETLTELTGRSDTFSLKLHDIEKRIGRASELDDIKELRLNLKTCLDALRETRAEEKKGSRDVAQRIQSQIETANRRMAEVTESALRELEMAEDKAEPEVAPVEESYVGVFLLQHADHIASRFGESTRREMLALISQNLKAVLGPSDRLVRWRGSALLVFVYSQWGIKGVREQLGKAVSSTSQQYINVGNGPAMLSVGVDWVVVPQSHYSSLNEVFSEVDSFIREKSGKAHGGAELSRRVG